MLHKKVCLQQKLTAKFRYSRIKFYLSGDFVFFDANTFLWYKKFRRKIRPGTVQKSSLVRRSFEMERSILKTVKLRSFQLKLVIVRDIKIAIEDSCCIYDTSSPGRNIDRNFSGIKALTAVIINHRSRY